MKLIRPLFFSLLLVVLVVVGVKIIIPHFDHSAKAAGPQTWYIRPDGGTRYDSNVLTGQCDGLADLAYPGTGVDQHCAFNDFRYMWDDQTYNSGSWVMSGGDTVIIRGCAASSTQQNSAAPDCRIGWDAPSGAGAGYTWCLGGGAYGSAPYGCYNPPIPSGTVSQPTRILGGNYQNCSTGNSPNTSAMAQIFGGWGVLNVLSLADTQNVVVECLNITSHNELCTVHGIPASPKYCNTSYPLDDYDGNGILVDNNTSNLLLQDVSINGHTTSGISGPIGANITLNRVFVGFNGFAGWNFDDGHDTLNATGASITANYVTMEGNGCYQQYPIVNSQFPARACYDDVSGGFGDSWSGQDSTLTSFTCNHCVQMYNTKDGFIGPHTQITNLSITNSMSIGNMGQQWKWNNTPNATTIFENNLTIGNCARMSQQLPGASQSFGLGSGNPGAYLSDFCRAAGDTFSFSSQANSKVLLANNTIISYSATVFDLNCGPAGGSAGTCGSTPFIFANNIFLGYTYPSSYPQAPGLFYLSDSSDVVSSSQNIEYGIRAGDACGVNGNNCTDPLFTNEPPQGGVPPESSLDNFNFTPSASSPAIGSGVAIPGLTTDYNGTTRNNPPTIGAIEVGGSGGGSTPPPSDTTPPTTSVTAPATGATISGTTSVTASAADNVGVTSVGFYVDGTLKTTDNSSPYTYSLNTSSLTNGTHTIYTKAYDAAGNIGTSNTISVTVANTVTDTTAPSVPTNPAVSSITSSGMTFSWTASTDNVGVTGYTIYQNGSKIGTSNTTSYAVTGLSASTAYTFTVSAYDAAGNTSAQSSGIGGTTSAGSQGSGTPVGPSGYIYCTVEGAQCSFSGTMSVAYGAGSSFVYQNLTGGTWCGNSVFTDPAVGIGKYCFTKAITVPTDTTPPTASITSPASNATISGTTSVTVTASDNVGVTSVALYVDNVLQGTDVTAPYTFSLNTLNLSNASHNLFTKAYDAAGNVGTSPTVSVTVANSVATAPSSGGGGTSSGGGGGGVVATPSFEITSVSIGPITNNSAKITVTTHVPASVSIQYGRTTNYGMATLNSPSLTTNYVNLAGLSSSTVYDFVVIATPQGGASIRSSVYTFETLGAATTTGTGGGTSIGSVSTPSAPTPTPTFTTSLSYGDSSSAIITLQDILHSQGFLPVNIPSTGYFGVQTEHALLLFQSAHLLNKSGFVDTQTEALLNKIVAASTATAPSVTTPVTPTVTSTPITGATSSGSTGTLTQNLGPGSTGAQVMILQHLLNEDGDYPAAIYSQYYGSLTEAAVKVFQTKYGIVSYGTPYTTGYGAVGPKTRGKVDAL